MAGPNQTGPFEAAASKNPPVVFILSPPRSGSTLLRVMLAGHPLLFAPQELELLSFDTLEERKAAFSGREGFWLEGTIRAVMEIKGCDAEQARKIMEDCENKPLTTPQFYRLMQEWIGERILVDKTPSYALDLEILKRAETVFEDALYIHLLRHPYGMIRSFEDSKLDQLYQVFFSSEHHFTVHEVAELIWLISHQNIATFLKDVPSHRQHRMSFEDLVSRPRPVIEEICRFLGLDFHPDMLLPYRDQKGRMTDGLYAASRMLGDVRFHEHRDVDITAADRWKENYAVDFLGDVTWQVAESLGYKREKPRRVSPPSTRNQLTPIQPLPRDGSVELPLSFAQQRLWFLDQLQPGLLSYNILKAVRLTGLLDLTLLERCFNEILQRHEILRSAFPTVEGRPVQVIAPFLRLPLPVVEMRDLGETDWKGKVQRMATEEAQRPFDLAKGPLLRAALVRVGDKEHVLILTVHHIVFDGWSFDVLFRELTTLYQHHSRGRPAPLPERRIQYADFAHWQLQWLQGEVLEAQLSYWRRQLDGDLPVLELPTDRPRSAFQAFRGAKLSTMVPKTLTDALERLSRQEGVTLFLTLLAAFKALLYRYTGQDDIIVGSLTAGRTRAEVEGLIGFFANTLVLRTCLAGNPSFRELLGRVREVALGAYGHQDLPFEKLVEALQPQRDMSRNPLFQVMFALQNIPPPSLELPGLNMRPLEVDSGTAMFDLSLMMANREQGLVGVFEYNTDLFDRATIVRMMGHFKTLLEDIVANPERRLSDLSILTDAERHRLLVEWNDTKTDSPKDECIHERFQAQVARTPDALAVVFEDEELTYRELNRRANRLAHHLKALGVGPEVLVGIFVERSLEMVVGLLGILKAGGAYVPLDPAYPQERLGFMLEDAGVSVLLTQQWLVERLPEHGAHVVCVDADIGTIARESEEDPSSGVSGDNLAYVIYTSGSTGRPKGVLISHRAVVNFLDSMHLEPGLTREDRLLSVTTLSFDIAGLELYLPLIVGAQVTVAGKPVSSDGSRLAELLERSGATVMQATPSTWRMLLETGWPRSNALRILCGGEALSREMADQLSAGDATLWNMYGPTETTIWSAVHRVGAEIGSVPIGSPIANTQLYILDSHLQPVPVGVPGELHIGGAGLARGYLNRPELTAEKFIPNPFSAEPGARLYKTGDRVRYRQDGSIEFLGRMDYQVKVRGFRIELAEIESVLRDHPGIRQAVVLAREEAPGDPSAPLRTDKRLVAYLVADQEPSPTVSELLDFVRNKLPDYMVPAAFVVLEALPLTSNGKVDRRALPAPDSMRPDLEAAYVAPQTQAERLVATVWQELLHLERVGVNDNFFDLGGHSLLMVQVHSRLRQLFDKNISMVELFQYPTIGSLSKYLSRQHDEPTPSQRVLDRARRQKEALDRQRRPANTRGKIQ